MNTLTDVLKELIRLTPAREESAVRTMENIVESVREKLDGILHGAETTVAEAQDNAQQTTPNVAQQTTDAPAQAPAQAPAETPAQPVPPVAGL